MSRTLLSFLFLFLLGGAAILPAHAQVDRTEDAFYIRAGGGIADYTGDATGTSGIADLFETDKFDDGPFPYAIIGEVGYHTSPALSIGLGYQLGQHPLIDNLEGQAGESIKTIRHMVQVLGRYTFRAQKWTIAPYIDGGVNASFGGPSTGIGYSVGLGLDAAVSSRVSLFLEGRFNTVFDDEATDGIDGDKPGDSLNPLPVIGVQVDLGSGATAPVITTLDGPTSVQAGKPFTYTAQINQEEATRPLSYRWEFGDGASRSGLTATHTYREAGTYSIVFTASNDAGAARETLEVNVEPAPEPASITAIEATPNPVDEGEPVRFSSNVQGDMPLSYSWSFGDGASADGGSPTHTYEEPGRYTVRLKVSNEAGEDTRTVTVRVSRALPGICTTINELSSTYFERNSSSLTKEGEESLQENADVLSRCPNLTVQVEGFAAPGERNPQSLSEDRARAVADFYEESGVPEGRIEATGQGQVEDVGTKKGEERQYRRADSIPQQDEEDM